VDDLNVQLRDGACKTLLVCVTKCPFRRKLSKLAFKRVRKAIGTFRSLAIKVSVEKRKRLEKRYADQGLFEFKEPIVQVCFFQLSIPCNLLT
jgi:hypothetical protein